MSDIYKENGFEDRNHYLHYLSDTIGDGCLQYWQTESLANSLGPEKDFTDLIAGLESLVYENS